MTRRLLAAAMLCVAALVVLAWLARAFVFAEIARAYFRSHGIAAAVTIDQVGLSGLSARFALGPRQAPVIAAERIELRFDPTRLVPRIAEVRLVHPLVRAAVTSGGEVSFGPLQAWIDSLNRQQGASDFVSQNLAVSLQGLRAIVETPAGDMEWDGDARLEKNIPVFLHLAARPAALSWRGSSLALHAATLDYRSATASMRFSGDIRSGAWDARGLEATLNVDGLRWVGGKFFAQVARLQATGVVAAPPWPEVRLALNLTARTLALTGKGFRADLDATSRARIGADFPALRKRDPPLARALTGNLAQLGLDFTAQVEKHGDSVSARLTRPLILTGAKGAKLEVSALSLTSAAGDIRAAFDLRLAGAGMPTLRASIRNLSWKTPNLSATAAFDARLDYGAFHGLSLGGQGLLSWTAGRYAFTPTACARFALAAFHPAANDLVKNARATLCQDGKTLLSGQGENWRFASAARGVAGFLPLADSQFDQGS
ncbi:MAG TPA: hypothetical protein VN685_08485, partial [Rhizomicrobium sp.]|nr:hypothetical protein [Rhizomicrobium sp.]